jgi:hypothetical protein
LNVLGKINAVNGSLGKEYLVEVWARARFECERYEIVRSGCSEEV